MHVPGLSEKEKLQMSFERDTSLDRKPGYSSSKMLSPARIRQELLDQIAEKQLSQLKENEVIAS